LRVTSMVRKGAGAFAPSQKRVRANFVNKEG
jgi:hypothetical protein